jgi:hypothetical protein
VVFIRFPLLLSLWVKRWGGGGGEGSILGACSIIIFKFTFN